MAVQFSTNLRNAMANQLEAVAGVSAILKIRTGSAPADCAAVDAGTVLATLNLPADWLLPAAGGAVAKSGTWEDQSADAAGIAAHFRIYMNDGVTCVLQGTVTATGSGGDLTVDNVNFAAGQAFTINAFSLQIANA